MRSFIVAFGLAVCFAAMPGTVVAQRTLPYYAVRMQGQAHFLYRIAVNGQTVFESPNLMSLGPRTYYISRYLQDGRNEIEVEFASDRKDPLVMMIMMRGNDGRAFPLGQFQTAPGETNGRRTMKTLAFTAHLLEPPATVTEAARREITTLLQAYYDALARRDAALVLNFYEPMLQTYTAIDPEATMVDRRSLVRDAKMYSDPAFRMKPYQSAGLRFAAVGQVIRVTRPSGLVMESDPVTVETTATTDGGNGTYRVKYQERLAQQSFEFEHLNGAWRFAVPTF